MATAVGASARRGAGSRRAARRPDPTGADEDATEATREPTAFTARMKHRRRRRGTATERGYRYEFLDADPTPAADESSPPAETTDASPAGAGNAGVRRCGGGPGVRAAGLASVGATADGAGTVPMMPTSWER